MVMTMKRGLLVLAVLLAGGVAYAGPSLAGEPKGPDAVSVAELAPWCGSSYPEVCISQHIEYQGSVHRMLSPVSNLVPYGWNDRASSICNTSGGQIRFWQHSNHTGYWWYLNDGYCYRDLTRVSMGGVGNFNDQITSISW